MWSTAGRLKKVHSLMFMLDLSDIIDQLSMANSVR